MFDKILERLGYSFEDLSPEERNTLLSMVSVVEQNQVSLETVKESIIRMKASVELDLVKEPPYFDYWVIKIPNRKHMLATARLQNYLLLEQLLSTPEKIKKQLDNYLNNLPKKDK